MGLRTGVSQFLFRNVNVVELDKISEKTGAVQAVAIIEKHTKKKCSGLIVLA